jgi:hypothetical protein
MPERVPVPPVHVTVHSIFCFLVLCAREKSRVQGAMLPNAKDAHRLILLLGSAEK